jgi:hypothetical protein
MDYKQIIQEIYTTKGAKRFVFPLHIYYMEDLHEIQKTIQTFSYIGKCKPLASHYRDYFGVYNNIVIHFIIINKTSELPLLEICYLPNETNEKDADQMVKLFTFSL